MEGGKKVAVVDASVVVKWFVPERNFRVAVAIRDAHLEGKLKLVSPSLVAYEVANALRFHRVYRLTPGEIAAAVQSLNEMGLMDTLSVEEWVKAVELSAAMNISVYDAVYAAMAFWRGATLITSDLKLYNSLKNAVNVTLLDRAGEALKLA